jgi:hypothetical protein
LHLQRFRGKERDMGKISAQEFLKKVAEDAAFRKELGITEEMDRTQLQAKVAASDHDCPEAERKAASEEPQDPDLDAVAGGMAPEMIRRAAGNRM